MVVLKSPFELWHDRGEKRFQNLFHEMIGLKLRGYGVEYPAGVLAVDTSDFVATHLLICQETSLGLQPITGFKTTLLTDCERHQISFPALGLVQAAEARPHIEIIKGIIARCLEENKSLCYTGSWTIEPELRRNKVLSRLLVDLFQAIYLFHHEHERIDEVITGGTMRFKADILLGNMGHDALALDGQVLEPIQVKHLYKENVRVLHLKKFTQHAHQVAEPFREMWENRLVICADAQAELSAKFRRAG